jgi:hypothetical protein
MNDNERFPAPVEAAAKLFPAGVGAFLGWACEVNGSPQGSFVQKLGEMTTTKDAIAAAIGAAIVGGAQIIKHILD